MPLLVTFTVIGLYVFLFNLKNNYLYLFADGLFINTFTKYSVNGTFNILFGLLVIQTISRLNLKNLSGLKLGLVSNWSVLVFPCYLFLIYIFEDYGFFKNISISLKNWLIAIYWTFSIGFIEELLFRALLQSSLIKKFKKNKISLVKSIIIQSLIFAAMHLIKLNSGFYGELSQFLYSFFIGFMFGVLLIITKRIWPLILLHMLIDLFAMIPLFESEITLLETMNSKTTVKEFYYQFFLLLPYFIYGLYLLKEYSFKDILHFKENN